MRALIAIALIAATAGPAAATPKQDLERGRASFRAKDFPAAIPVLSYLLYPNVLLGDRDDAIEAYILLGAAAYETGDRERAAQEFKKALQLDVDRSITTLNFSDGAVKLFEDTKAELGAQLARDAEAKKLAEDRARIEAYRKSLVVYERRSYGVNFVPFGAGQFQNKDRPRGFFFAATEGVTAATSVGIFLYLAGNYGLVNHNIPKEENGNRIRRLQQTEIVAGSAFFGFYLLGVIEAIYHYKPRAQIEGDDTLLPPDMRKLDDKKQPKTSILDRIHVGPMVTPTGAGIGVSWEND